MPRRQRPGLSTTALHGGRGALDADSPVVEPLVQSVNFILHAGTAEGLKYQRYGNNPGTETLNRRLALLEGAEAAMVLGSGMGATACAMLALLRPGDHLVASEWIYGGTLQLFSREFDALGIEVTFVNPLTSRVWRKRLRKHTRAFFVETPVNPSCRVI